MKRTVFASLLALLMLTVICQRPGIAFDDGPSANGKFQFQLEDNNNRYIEFDARLHGDQARGTMTFSDPSSILGDSDSNDVATGAVVTAKFDCLKIDGHRAVMGGAVSESNFASLIGHRVLLVVEDNGEGVNVLNPDRLTWGIYDSNKPNWIPVDAEDPNDIGASLKWIAKDAERDDDVGIPSQRDTTVGCTSFPLTSYSFVDIPHGSGNVQVKP
jgi:hypothetical protein